MTKMHQIQRYPLANLPTPLQPLKRLSDELGGPEIWIKRDDCTAFGGGGNKLRKLEYLVADAIGQGADTLITVGGIQSNHTRQTAAAAAKAGLKCVLLHLQWVDWPTPHYDQVGNFLLGKILGADVRVANIGPDESLLVSEHLIEEIAAELRAQGGVPYVIPSGASDHPYGGLGYFDCAMELVEQQKSLGLTFDYLLHATSSGSTQAGLIAGFQALDWPTQVIGVDVNGDEDWIRETVSKIAYQTCHVTGQSDIDLSERIQIEPGYAGPAYGIPDEPTREAIELVGRLEAVFLDPVYEGKSMAALIGLVQAGRFDRQHNVLFHYLGGSPAIHGYSDLFIAE